ncbi:MAG: putative transposase [Saprospiraceae bacterium]
MAPSGKFNFRHPSPVIENQWNIKMSTPYKITLDQMPEQIRHNKLKTESKKLKNIIVVLSYRGECAIKNIIAPVYKNTENDGRKLIQEIFTTDADIAIDNQAKTCTVTLHTLSSPRHNDL